MPNLKNGFQALNKISLKTAGAIALLVLSAVLFWLSSTNNCQAVTPTAADICFEGEYRIGNGPWQPVSEEEHIPATKGDVTLRGFFNMRSPDGTHIGPLGADIPVAFFLDHIGITVCEEGNEPYVMDNENPLFGASACGKSWLSYSFSGDGSRPVEIIIHNPHRFGNETAVDDLLSNVAVWSNMSFEKSVIARGETQRNIGLVFVIVSLVLLGTALISTITHIKNSNIIWLLGLAIFFAGGYFIYSADGIFFLNESTMSNTTALGISMILYLLFVSAIISDFLTSTKKAGAATVIVLGTADAALLLLPLISEVYFYDTLPLWVLSQTLCNISLTVCVIKEFYSRKITSRWLYLGMLLPLISFETDAVMTFAGIWKGGQSSKYVFIVMIIVAIAVVIRIIYKGVNATKIAKELEAEKKALDAELAESRISTMMSQIRPHFIYNTLGSIEQLCEVNPAKAGELVHNFAKYLRGNFGELDNPRPIRMSQEMEHVRHYISIENVRFPDMTFSFEMNSEDFSLPALTIQPIVENAIKHGLMKLQKGGSIKVVSYETDKYYCVTVEDDGVGFDTSILLTDRKHVGIRNIRGRLEAMVNGTLEIESTPGTGTKVLIKIPKESNI